LTASSMATGAFVRRTVLVNVGRLGYRSSP
jgi:hypothetical protein